MKQLRMIDAINDKLDALVEQRKKNAPHLSITKQSLVAELIEKAHKRECK